MPLITSAFLLPHRLAAKSGPALIAADEQHFAALAATLEEQLAELTHSLDELRTARAGRGRKALDRDLEIHRLSARLRLLRRYSIDICLGRMLFVDDPTPVYVGRLGLRDPSGRRLLIDWRTPAAQPFFAATLANPEGLISRRRYRWSGGRVIDYWDEVFDLDALPGQAALDQQSAFIASLAASRSSRMRDVLSTIAADQDAIVRAGSQGALVVDGGPGTGKTVVALHRAAYLTYRDPRLGRRRGGVLFVGPSERYLAYVADVLPSLGEEDVQAATLRDLVPEGARALEEADPEVAALKSSAAMVSAVEPAVGLYEEPPAGRFVVETPWADLMVRQDDWAEAFDAVDSGTPHNEARDQVWEALLEILLDRGAELAEPHDLRRALLTNGELRQAFSRAWPILEYTDLVADLWAVPAYLRRCAPWLSPEQARLLRRAEGSPWTTADLPLLDAMRHRLGDPDSSARNRRRQVAEAADRAFMDDVVHDLLAADDDPESGLQRLNRASIRDSLVHDDEPLETDPLDGPFAHVIVDEAQELTDAEWQLLMRRCPTRSFTVVGDRAQARHGFVESWADRLGRVGFDSIEVATLTVNYRTPRPVMRAAEPVIRSVLPNASVPTSIRDGAPVRYATPAELDSILDAWLQQHEGVAAVIGDPGFVARERVTSLRAAGAKGLEFDLVLLVDPDAWGTGIEACVDRYVAMTRATQQLVVLRER